MHFVNSGLLNWHYYRIHLLALKTLKCFTWKASIPLVLLMNISVNFASKSVCWWSSGFHFFFIFISNAFLSSPLPNLVDPRLSGAEWKWKLVIHQSTFFTCVTTRCDGDSSPSFTRFSSYLEEPNRRESSFSYFRRRNKNVTAATHLRCTPVGRTGPSSAGVLGCNGGRGLPPSRRHSGPDRARTASFWSGRSPVDRRPDTHSGRGTWAPQTYLHTKIKEILGERKWACKWHTSRIRIHTVSFLFFFFLITARFGFLGA